MRAVLHLALFALALLPAPAVPAAHADSTAVVRAQLQRQYDAAARAFRRRDVAAIVALSTPNMTSRRPNGQVWNRKQLQVYLNLSVGALKTIDAARFRVDKVTVRGKEAVALVDHTVSGTLGGGSGVKGAKPRRIVDVSTDRDTWVKTAAGWRIRFTECVKERVTLDGKPVKPTPALKSDG